MGMSRVGIGRRNCWKYEPNMVTLANHDKGNFWANFEFLAGLWIIPSISKRNGGKSNANFSAKVILPNVVNTNIAE